MNDFKPKKEIFDLPAGYSTSKTTDLASPAKATPRYAVEQPPVINQPAVKPNKTRRKFWFALAGIVMVLIIGGLLIYKSKHTAVMPASVVPSNVSKAVSFDIYYPDPKKLPQDYALDLNSFSSPLKNGVAYSVTYADGKKLIFSCQLRPSDGELESFKSNFIPLTNEYQTKYGQADIGAYNNQTLVSLPILNGPWIVITGPPDTNQDKLKLVIDALVKSN